MNDWSASQIRELIEQAISHERYLRDTLRNEDRERFEEFKKTSSRALALQAKEYERRLDVLNHAHAEAQRVLTTYIPRELYDRAHAEVVDWQRKADVERAEVNARIKSVELGLVNLPGGVKSLELGLASQTGRQVGATTTLGTMITIIAVIVAAIGGFIGILSYVQR